jgi:hypothetical protein
MLFLIALVRLSIVFGSFYYDGPAAKSSQPQGLFGYSALSGTESSA